MLPYILILKFSSVYSLSSTEGPKSDVTLILKDLPSNPPVKIFSKYYMKIFRTRACFQIETSKPYINVVFI